MADAFLARHGHRTRVALVSRGGHPVPDDESFEAGARALQLADANRARDELLVVLLSGGASAMLAAPAEGVTREQKIAATRNLLASGRPIAEINAVRTQMSAIKGGKLARRAGRSVTFALSDVHAPIEDDPSVIGSGPTVVGGARIEGRGTTTSEFVLIGSRRDAMAGARAEAERRGYEVFVIDEPVLGEAREAATALAGRLHTLARRTSRPLCVIASGETTVRLPASGEHGRGGRNQEFALAAALALADDAEWALLAAGTDGIDGPTDAAGAIVDATTMTRAREKGLDAHRALEAHDSYPFFAALGDHIVTGPTGTNVGDIVIFVSLIPDR
jgi:glycerate-2-kinase